MQGIIKVLKNGFGFITPSETEGESDERQGDIFFHATDCNEGVFNTLNVGDTLSFEMGEGRDGKPKATNVVAE